jgi:hypothetical protein
LSHVDPRLTLFHSRRVRFQRDGNGKGLGRRLLRSLPSARDFLLWLGLLEPNQHLLRPSSIQHIQVSGHEQQIRSCLDTPPSRESLNIVARFASPFIHVCPCERVIFKRVTCINKIVHRVSLSSPLYISKRMHHIGGLSRPILRDG